MNHIKFGEVNRLEVIGDKRLLVKHNIKLLRMSGQDGGKTLKIFIKEEK